MLLVSISDTTTSLCTDGNKKVLSRPRDHRHAIVETAGKQQNILWKESMKSTVKFTEAMSHHISEYLGLAEGKWRKSLYNNEKSSIKNDIHMKRHFQLIYGLWMEL